MPMPKKLPQIGKVFKRKGAAPVSDAVADERLSEPIVITVVRDAGTDAHDIGRTVALELGIPFYDKEILVRAAKRMGESMEALTRYDERTGAEFGAFLPDRADVRTLADRMFEEMAQVIRDLGSTESCVIEGRLSDYILQANPNLIAVHVTAPLEERIRFMMTARGISHDKAARLVRDHQHARERFYRRYSAGKWKVAQGHDLEVNQAKLGKSGCVDVIAAAYRAKARQLGIEDVPAGAGSGAAGAAGVAGAGAVPGGAPTVTADPASAPAAPKVTVEPDPEDILRVASQAKDAE